MKTNTAPLARKFQTQVETPTVRRVRARGLQVPKTSSCRPGPLTRRPGREICRLGILLLLAIVVVAAAPTAEPKIAIIDLKRVFDKYWKTKQANADLEEQKADISKKKKGILDDYQKVTDDYKKLVETANDQAVSSDERERRKSAAEKKLMELKEIEQTATLFQRNSEENLALQVRRRTENILRDIRELVDAKARAAGYTLVIDTAAQTGAGTPFVLYNNGQNDLTEEILSQLNAAAPIGLQKPDAEKDKSGDKNEDKKEGKK